MPIVEIPEIEIPQPGQTHQIRDIKRVNNDYAALEKQYTFLRDSYTGGGGYETYKDGYFSDGSIVGQRPERTYLQRYPREATAKWNRRLEGAYYPNWIRRIVGVYAGLLTRQEAQPQNYPDDVLEWQSQVDWANQRARVVPWLLVYPTAFILTDMPQVPQDAVSAAQAGEAEPYARFIHPDRALDWLYDENGNLVYFKYSTDLDRIVDPMQGHEYGTRYTVFTVDGWWYYDIWGEEDSGEAMVLDGGVWPDTIQGMVPVAVYHSGLARDDQDDVSPIEYISRVMMRLYNVLSQKSSTEDGSAFPVLLVPVKGPDDIQEITWSEDTAIPFPWDASKAPHFAGYDVGPIEHMTNEAERLIKQLKDLASIGFDDDAGDTGIARAYSFMMTDVTLIQIQSAMIALEADVMGLMARWLGAADGMPSDADPGFPDKFDLVVAREEIENANNMLMLELGPVAATEVKRKALETYIQQVDPATAQALEDEFDAMAEQEQTAMNAQDEALEMRESERSGLGEVDIEPR